MMVTKLATCDKWNVVKILFFDDVDIDVKILVVVLHKVIVCKKLVWGKSIDERSRIF